MSKPTPKAALKAIDKRDGRECSWHGVACDLETLSPQHRQGGMGGRKGKHRLSNIVWLCSRLNGLIESDAKLAEEARQRGIKISLHADPTAIPVTYSDGRTWLLDDEGGKTEITT